MTNTLLNNSNSNHTHFTRLTLNNMYKICSKKCTPHFKQYKPHFKQYIPYNTKHTLSNTNLTLDHTIHQKDNNNSNLNDSNHTLNNTNHVLTNQALKTKQYCTQRNVQEKWLIKCNDCNPFLTPAEQSVLMLSDFQALMKNIIKK